jgi:hypothetical protein
MIRPTARRAAPTLAALLAACGGPGPTGDDVDTVVETDDDAHTDAPGATACPTAGVPHGLRRLTRFQYDRVASDLLGEDVALASGFPAESGSWEGLVEAQAVGPLQVAAWWDAAATLAARVVDHRVATVEVEDLGLDVGEAVTLPGQQGTWWSLDVPGTGTTVALTLPASHPGRWRVGLRAVWLVGFGQGLPAPRLTWRLGDQDVDGGAITGQLDAPSTASVEVDLDGATDVTLTIRLEGVPADSYGAVALDRITLDGPLDHPELTQSAAWVRWHPCTPDADDLDGCVRDVVTAFADAAWRRAPADDEVDGLLDLVALALDEGDDVEVGLGLAMRAVLASPSFLYRVEDVGALAPGAVRAATPGELATRLALLLWGSLPDAELRACAASGALTADLTSTDPCGLPAQVERLLAAPRSDALQRDLGRQWLGLDAAAGFTRDPVRYPFFDADLASAMVDGVLGTLTEARRTQADLTSLVDARWGWGNARIAGIYGVPRPRGGEGRLELPGDRAGLLGSAFVLTATSHPDRPSPVLRGKWILDRLLCDPPDPPPPGVPALPSGASSGDVRAFLAAHSADPVCAHCHQRIDPLGLPLEGFDAVGTARTAYEDGTPIDTTSTLPDGTPVDGLAALAALVADDPDTRHCLVRHVATWVWERFPTDVDAPILADAEARATEQGFTLDAIVAALVATEPLLCVTAPDDEAAP